MTDCPECQKLRARISELEGEIASIITTRKATVQTQSGVPVSVEIDVDTLLASEFLTKRIDEIDWGKRIGKRIIAACENQHIWVEPGVWEPHPIKTIADLIIHGNPFSFGGPFYAAGVGNVSLARIKQVLHEHGLSFNDRDRLRAALQGGQQNMF